MQVIPAQDLRHLANVLTLESCTEATYQNALALLTHLSYASSRNRHVLLAELTGAAEVLASAVTRRLLALNERLAEKALPPFVALGIP